MTRHSILKVTNFDIKSRSDKVSFKVAKPSPPWQPSRISNFCRIPRQEMIRNWRLASQRVWVYVCQLCCCANWCCRDHISANNILPEYDQLNPELLPELIQSSADSEGLIIFVKKRCAENFLKLKLFQVIEVKAPRKESFEIDWIGLTGAY